MSIQRKQLNRRSLVWALSLVFAIGPQAVSHAAYDRSVTRTNLSSLDVAKAFDAQFASPSSLFQAELPQSALQIALNDGETRISPQFRVPGPLRETVGFWLRVYTELTTQQVALHDDHHPEIVYEVLDFRDLASTARNQEEFERLSRRAVGRKLWAYRRAFEKLSRNPRPRNPNEAERAILAAIRRSSHKHSFREHAENLRAQRGQRDTVMKGLLAAEHYMPAMERIFAAHDIPIELTRLSLVESTFDHTAVSKVGATGVWQFMLRSARGYMKVSPEKGVDERLSPLKSTIAAARLLRDHHRYFDNWALTITSYNHGLRGLVRLPKRLKKSSDLVEVFSLCTKKSSPLGWASRNYYSEFLALLHAETYRDLFYGRIPAPESKPFVLHRLEAPQSALNLAMERGIPLQMFRYFNPDILDVRKQLPKGFWIVLPRESEDHQALIRSVSEFGRRERPLRAAISS